MAAVVALAQYEKRVSKLLAAHERIQMECSISENPERHPVIPGTGGFRKARWKRQGRGKSGGIRVIYYFAPTPEVVYMADAYAKSEKDDLTNAEKNALKRIAQEVEEQLGG
jgi:mRNA-degrading endonuclease RelE of RelBE toxin-antitoxin system